MIGSLRFQYNVHSDHIGSSVYVSLLKTDQIACNLDCVYCFCCQLKLSEIAPFFVLMHQWKKSLHNQITDHQMGACKGEFKLLLMSLLHP